ncbi:hypothetical protein MA16_Dca023962 [Dendrobium catenatum]|uniref:Uncharacterized protein n=1 Tax=Dendrobium catenatum TaxID=906689 RepID=A0A2I0VJG1_9ASPA|nr:hypothetical protein MA16_Dca023962 [Dendrobium catenatum]
MNTGADREWRIELRLSAREKEISTRKSKEKGVLAAMRLASDLKIESNEWSLASGSSSFIASLIAVLERTNGADLQDLSRNHGMRLRQRRVHNISAGFFTILGKDSV